jgi:hypothetical protein
MGSVNDGFLEQVSKYKLFKKDLHHELIERKCNDEEGENSDLSISKEIFSIL